MVSPRWLRDQPRLVPLTWAGRGGEDLRAALGATQGSWAASKACFKLIFFKVIQNWGGGSSTRTSYKQKATSTLLVLDLHCSASSPCCSPRTCLHCRTDDHVNITQPGICTSAEAAESLMCSQSLHTIPFHSHAELLARSVPSISYTRSLRGTSFAQNTLSGTLCSTGCWFPACNTLSWEKSRGPVSPCSALGRQEELPLSQCPGMALAAEPGPLGHFNPSYSIVNLGCDSTVVNVFQFLWQGCSQAPTLCLFARFIWYHWAQAGQ